MTYDRGILKDHVISYRLTLETPAKLVGSSRTTPETLPNGLCRSCEHLTIPASSLRGTTRAHLRMRSGKAAMPGRSDPDLLLFGAHDCAGHMWFSDLTCEAPEALGEESWPVLSGALNLSQHHYSTVVRAGTSFLGKVYFDAEPTGLERSRALTAILDIESIGAEQHLGNGYCSVAIIERTAPLVFISYAWEDAAHIEWTRRLAERLRGCGIDVLLDQLHPLFDPTARQAKVDEWMVRAIETSDKVLSVLTPTYRRKADENIGGVAFELRRLQAEGGLISGKLSRYVAAIARGEPIDSCPRILAGCRIFDLRMWPDAESTIEALASELRR